MVLAYNPDAKDWGSRSPLSLGLSFDNGKTWPEKIDIETGKKTDEFSYPAIISWGDSVAVSLYLEQTKNCFLAGNKE